MLNMKYGGDETIISSSMYSSFIKAKFTKTILSLGQTTIHFSRLLLHIFIAKIERCTVLWPNGWTFHNTIYSTFQLVLPSQKILPLRATTTKTIQKIWYDKTECDQGKIIVFEAVPEREYLFHESERKVKAGKGYFKNNST